MFGHNPGTSRSDFGGNPDLDPDPGIFKRNFIIVILATVKAAHQEFGNSPNVCRSAELQLKN